MKRFLGFVFLLCIACAGVRSQNETSKWYFGSTAAVDFLSGAPVALTNSVLSSSEGSASIADPGGNLLFYTNGNTVWNANHVSMSNGTGLFGSSISCQSAVIVRQPGSVNLYYVFTMRNWTDAGNGAHYSIVDMSLAAGLGDVTTKNQLIYGNTRESLTAVCHQNGTDAWIVIHDMFTNEFRSYLFTAGGLSAVPVISATGAVFAGANRYGSLKSSPDGTRIGYALGGSGGVTTEIYNFDRTTGAVSNSITLNNGVFNNAYGIEFSPNNQVLYVCEYNGAAIQQFNLAAGTPALVLASNTSIASGGNTKANLQLGPDGRIYVCLAYQAFLGVVNTPNTLGLGCGFVNNSLSLAGRTCGLGLPNFMPCLIPVILPQPWIYAEAQQQSDAVKLDWGIAAHDGLRSFGIERRTSTDAGFKEVGALPSLALATAFEWIDHRPARGVNAYRIAAHWMTRETQYSEVMQVEFWQDGIEFEIFPNPIMDTKCLQVHVQNYHGPLELELSDMNMKTIARWTVPVAAHQTSEICKPDLPLGIYYLKATTDQGLQKTHKLAQL